jgi:type II secretory pathway pseudopilin PulG
VAAARRARIRPLGLRLKQVGPAVEKVSRPYMDTLVTFRTFFRRIARAEDGLTLIEVVITTLFVALIAIATLTGFQDIDRTSVDERFHDEAAQLAAQSQEQLRTDPASILDELEGSESHSHVYTTAIDNNTYTITQEANYVNESRPGSDCLATAAGESSSKNDGDYLRVTSRVTWPQISQTGRVREPVSESSIITPPDGSALEVDATTGESPEQALSGVTPIVEYTGVKATKPTKIEGTTGTAGCVVFGGIPATSAKVEIEELPGYVTTSGALKVPPKEATIAPNITTHDPVVLNRGGAITAKFTYNNSGKIETVYGSTFVAAFEEVTNAATEFTVGAPTVETTPGVMTPGFVFESGGEHKYKTVTTEPYYSKTATTPKGTGYATGDLFPFPYLSTTKREWLVYAGDCKENNAHTIDSSVEDGKAIVKAGETTGSETAPINVPMTDLIVDVYTGTTNKTVESKEPLVKITNTQCAKASTPNNASAANLEHEQKLTKTGNLKYPYQPFGAEKVCIVGEATTKTVSGKSVTEYHTQTVEPDLTSLERTDVFYLGEEASYTPTGGADKVTVTSSTSKLSC